MMSSFAGGDRPGGGGSAGVRCGAVGRVVTSLLLDFVIYPPPPPHYLLCCARLSLPVFVPPPHLVESKRVWVVVSRVWHQTGETLMRIRKQKILLMLPE